MKKHLLRFFQAVSLILLLLAFTSVNAQRRYSPLTPTGISDYSITMTNDIQVDCKTMTFDIYVLDTDPSQPFELAAIQAGITVNSAIYNGGTITMTIVAGTSTLLPSQQPTSVIWVQSQNCIKLTAKAPPGAGNGTILSTVAPGNRVCTLKMTNTVNFASAQVNLTYSFTTVPYPTKIAQYISGINTQLTSSLSTCFYALTNPTLSCGVNWTGAVSTDWFTTGNWSTNAIPTSADNVIIPLVTNLPVINGSTLAACGTANVASGASITVNGKLTASGITTLNGTDGLIINDGGSFIDNGIAGAGTAKMTRAMGINEWHYISPPISNAKATIFNQDWLMFYSADFANGWLSTNYIIDPNFTLVPTKGYSAYIQTTHVTPKVFDGTLNSNAPAIACIVQTTPAGTGYNLVGNAYASAIDLANAGITWPSTSHTAYFWDPGNANYKIYTTVSPTHTQYAPSIQGFFIEAPVAGNFQVPNSARVHNSETFLKDSGTYPNVLQLEAVNQANGKIDQAVVGFVPGTTTGYDFNYDAIKLACGPETPMIYSLLSDNKQVAFNIMPSMSESPVVPMGFSCGVNSNFTINASNLESFDASTRIYLEDLKEGIIQDLKANPSYAFNYTTGEFASRFVLHFTGPTGINDQQANGVQIYTYESSLYIRNLDNRSLKNVFVYDLIGKEVFRSALNQSPLQKFVLPVNQGYYLVKVVSASGVTTRKVYIN